MATAAESAAEAQPEIETELITVAADAEAEASGLACIAMPLMLAGLWMTIAVGVKRYHDRNKSGRWLLLGLIPLVGFWVLAEMAFFPAVELNNRFGPPPNW
jgi:uncharacterized membrane protein YhaH (DUF805 family)